MAIKYNNTGLHETIIIAGKQHSCDSCVPVLCRMVHGECDDVIDEAMLAARPEEQPEYQCRICRNMDPEVPALTDSE